MFDGGMITQWIFRATHFFDKPTFRHLLNRFPSLFSSFDISNLSFLRGHVRFLRTSRQAAQPKVAKVLVSIGLTGSTAETIGGKSG